MASVRDRLDIVLITFNREKHLKRTLNEILSPESPIRDFDITILDNRSTDGTSTIVGEFVKSHPSLHYIQNHYNIGGNGNIAKAMEFGRKEYLWIICDDDSYSWDSWCEVENAIEQKKDVICTCRFELKKHPDDMAYRFLQITFLPGLIVNTRLYTDTTMRNVFDNIFIFFPHLVPIVTHINKGGTIHLIKGSIVTECNHSSDTSYFRGCDEEDLFLRSKKMNFIIGFCNLLANLKDRSFARKCFNVLIAGDRRTKIGYVRLFGEAFIHLRGRENAMHYADMILQAPFFVGMGLRVVQFLQNTFFYRIAMHSHLYNRFRAIADKECDQK